MSVRNSLLALLSSSPMGVAELQREFVARTSHTWDVNIGQVYTTLQRLERDGLVAATRGGPGDSIERYDLTAPGRAELAAWWSTPVGRDKPERDELVMKIALAAATSGVDVRAVVQAQRSETMRVLRDLTKLSAHAPDPAAAAGADADHAWMLVIDHRIFVTEAEMRWLDHVEARIVRWQQDHPGEGSASPDRAAAPVDGPTKVAEQV